MWELILQGYKHPSDKKGTLRQYEKVWSGFVGFCGKDTKRALSFEAKDVANFASKMFDDGATGSAVNAAITALDETRGVVDPSLPPLGQMQFIKKLRRAAKKRRPPRGNPFNLTPTSILCLSTGTYQGLGKISSSLWTNSEQKSLRYYCWTEGSAVMNCARFLWRTLN